MRTFDGQSLTQIAMPMGGIGAGCVCLTGIGAIHDFSIRNRPDTTAQSDGHGVRDTAFALLHVKGAKPVTLLCEGPIPTGWVYDRGLQAQGMRWGGYEGMPRFRGCRFVARYPFGTVELSDPDSPVDVTITGWSPFIPLDDRSSGAPAAIVEYALTNRSGARVDVELSYHVSNWAVTSGTIANGARSALVPGGVSFTNSEPSTAETFGSAAMVVVGHGPKVKASWFRGGWFDAISKLWRECDGGTFVETPPTTTDGGSGRHGGSVLVPTTLAPGATVTIPVILAWHFPNSNVTAGVPAPEAAATSSTSLPVTCCGPGSDCGPDAPKWKPWYTTQWPDAASVASFVRGNFASLRSRTAAFADALHGSTFPDEVIDAVASNLAILKSPTVIRQSSGNLWGWEGCFPGNGCCHGSCTHVWNYAQALPHLFPQLERTLREGELERSMDDRGHANFRTALPDGPTSHTYHAAADGQLGGIMKVWRDWQIGGDHAWLARMYPLAKRSLEYCRHHWDPDGTGLLVEPHHNTYDIEFWGPDGMCTSVYLGALTAMAHMTEAVGDPAYAAECRDLTARGATAMARTLFNGEYYCQNVRWTDLRDTSFADRLDNADLSNPSVAESVRLERAEGPKYQYGEGCLSDGVIGDWMTTLYGLPPVADRAQVRQTLAAIYRYNFKPDLSRHACLQRPGYATGGEAGLVLCTWPRGGRLMLPFPYSDEVWTGIEYQVASHLMLERGAGDRSRRPRAIRRRQAQPVQRVRVRQLLRPRAGELFADSGAERLPILRGREDILVRTEACD
jgi:uncharacterized protein (DUF608 family)